MYETISELVRLQLGLKKVNAVDRFVEDLGAESADLINIIATVEEKFGIALQERDIAGIRSVGDLHAAVEKLTGDSPASAGKA